MPPFDLGLRSFETKGAATDEVRRVLNSAEIDKRLMGDTHVLIKDLFGMHPSAGEKSIGGVTGFMVRTNDYHGARTRGFHVIHDNGSTTAFSYIPCLRPAAAEPTLATAARAAIIVSQREILLGAFWRKATVPCAHCAAEITRDKAHVHHEPPKFRAILDEFVAKNGEPKVISATNNGLGDVFADPSVRAAWIKFHDARAIRAVVCAPCNYAAERKPCK